MPTAAVVEHPSPRQRASNVFPNIMSPPATRLESHDVDFSRLDLGALGLPTRITYIHARPKTSATTSDSESKLLLRNHLLVPPANPRKWRTELNGGGRGRRQSARTTAPAFRAPRLVNDGNRPAPYSLRVTRMDPGTMTTESCSVSIRRPTQIPAGPARSIRCCALGRRLEQRHCHLTALECCDGAIRRLPFLLGNDRGLWIDQGAILSGGTTLQYPEQCGSQKHEA